MAQPNSRTGLVEYCLRRLGKGAIDINVTDEQIEDRIDDALDYFYQFQFDGVEKKYTKIQVTANNIANGWVQMPSNTIGVTRIFPLNGDAVNSNINGDFNIFDLNYQLRLNELYDFTSADYVYFELANEHIRTLEMLFIGEVPIRYNRYTNILYADMTWTQKCAPGSWLIAECWVQVDPSSGMFWNDMMLKQFATAMIKRQWGENLKKIKGVNLPGGITVDGQSIYDEAVKEIDQLKETIRETFEAPPEFYTG